MKDQERIADLLTREKRMSSRYDVLASECLNMPLRDSFLTFFTLSHRAQTELLQAAQAKGWYNPEQAQDSAISQAYARFSSKKPQ